jgi:hypothetical protein
MGVLGGRIKVMRREVEFKMKCEDGTKYEVRVSPFGGKFKFQFKEQGAESWDYERQPERVDLAELLDIIKRRYARRRLSAKDMETVERMLKEFDIKHPPVRE